MLLRCGSVGAPPVLERISFEEANGRGNLKVFDVREPPRIGRLLGDRPMEGEEPRTCPSHRSHSASGSSPRRMLFGRWLCANGTAAEGHRTPDGVPTSLTPIQAHTHVCLSAAYSSCRNDRSVHSTPWASTGIFGGTSARCRGNCPAAVPEVTNHLTEVDFGSKKFIRRACAHANLISCTLTVTIYPPFRKETRASIIVRDSPSFSGSYSTFGNRVESRASHAFKYTAL